MAQLRGRSEQALRLRLAASVHGRSGTKLERQLNRYCRSTPLKPHDSLLARVDLSGTGSYTEGHLKLSRTIANGANNSNKLAKTFHSLSVGQFSVNVGRFEVKCAKKDLISNALSIIKYV